MGRNGKVVQASTVYALHYTSRKTDMVNKKAYQHMSFTQVQLAARGIHVPGKSLFYRRIPQLLDGSKMQKLFLQSANNNYNAIFTHAR